MPNTEVSIVKDSDARINIRIPKDLHRSLKIKTVERGVSMTNVIISLIATWVDNATTL